MLDETQADGTITASPANDEASAQQAQPTQAASTATDPSASGDTTTAADQSQTAPAQDRERSLTSQTGPQNAEDAAQQQPASNDWEKKYHEIAKGFGRMRNEYGTLRQQLDQYRQQYEGIDPNAVKAWKQQQETAAQAKLPRWHAKHPEAPMFKQQFAEYQRLAGLFARAKTDEAKAEIAAEIERFPANERQDFEAFNSHRRQTVERIAEEMTGYNSLDEMLEAKMASKFNEYQARSKAEVEVGKWFDDPKNQPIVEYTRDAMAEALQDGVPLPYVQRLAQLQYTIDNLESRLAGTDKVVAAAQARTQAAKANASITRDVANGARKVDPKAVAKERGITDLSSSAYVELLSELSSKNLI